MLTLIYMVFVIVASLVLGRLSDRLGRRKVFVFVASALQGVAALLLALVPDLTVAMVGAGPARPRLRLLPLGRPGAGHPGAARPGRARQGPRHHEHRHRGAAGDRRRCSARSSVVVAGLVRCSCSCSPAVSRFAGALAVLPVQERALMTLDLRMPASGTRMPRPGRRPTRTGRRSTAATAAPRRRVFGALHLGALSPQRARHAAPRERHADPRGQQVACACRGVVEAVLAHARIPRRARLHAGRGAVAGRDDRRRRRRLPDAPSGRAIRAARRPTPSSRAGSPSWSTRSAQLDLDRRGASPPAAREPHPGLPSSSTRRGTSRLLGHIGVLALAGARPGRRRRARCVGDRRAARLPARRHDGRTRRRSPGSCNAPSGQPGRRRRGAARCSALRWPSCVERRAARRRGGARARRARVRQRRRHRLPRAHGGRPVGDRDRGRVGHVRAAPVRQLRALHAGPAAAFALDVVRRPAPGSHATLLGGGWIASGPARGRPAAADRVAGGAARWCPARWPARCRRPVSGSRGPAARRRPRVAAAHQGGRARRAPQRVRRRRRRRRSSTTLPTYRGEGKAFL